jgi:protein-serine/threonine kinase
MLSGEGRKRWRAVRPLGEGTFSKVVLAEEETDEVGGRGRQESFVAIKIVEHGPAGGASEERVESSLKRELDILKEVKHPSLVRLEAFAVERTRALLVLRYYAGGDLFELAATRRDVLTSAVVQRIFAELVAATRYLHKRNIVHRDIKLESAFFFPPFFLPSSSLCKVTANFKPQTSSSTSRPLPLVHFRHLPFQHTLTPS